MSLKPLVLPAALRWYGFRLCLALCGATVAYGLFFQGELGLSIPIFLLILALLVASLHPAPSCTPQALVTVGLLVLALLPLIELPSFPRLLLGLLGLSLFAQRLARPDAWPGPLALLMPLIQTPAGPYLFTVEFIRNGGTLARALSFQRLRPVLASLWLPVGVGGLFLALFSVANPMIERFLEALVPEWSPNTLLTDDVVFWLIALALIWPWLRRFPRYGTAELAQLTQSFLDMAERLDARSAYLSSFAAHVSHALKSPLTAIQGAAELLRDALDPDEPAMTPETQRRFLSNIIADTDRLTRLLAQLRDLARAETLPTPGACTLAAFLPDWAETLAGLKVTWNGDIETGVALPAESLQMVLGHLAENAAQHGAQRLSLDAKADGAVLSLRVCDDGPGIDPQNRDQIFESFFTTQQTRGGTGLGLAIVRASLGAYRGTITLADSGPLPGACFVISLPRNQ